MKNQFLPIQKKVNTLDEDFITQIMNENKQDFFLGTSVHKVKIIEYIKRYKHIIITLPPKTGKTTLNKEFIKNLDLYCSLSNDDNKYLFIEIDFSPLKDFIFISFQYLLDKFFDIIRISLDKFIEFNINKENKDYFLKEKDPINCLNKLLSYKKIN